MYMNLFDSHVHSDNSHDGEHSITFLCENAEQKNLMGLCITDHYELDQNLAQADLCLRNSFMETGKARQAFDYRLVVMNGIEMGQAIQNKEKAQEILRRYRFDFVLGSLHCIRGMDDFAYIDFSDLDVDVILTKSMFKGYGWLTASGMSWNDYWNVFRMYRHALYITNVSKEKPDLSRYDSIIDEILRTLAQKGLGLEINTAGLRREIGQTAPTLPYIKRFRQLGGEILTFGSDAHRAQDLGAGLDTAIEMAKEAGFSYFAFFKKREPRMLSLR